MNMVGGIFLRFTFVPSGVLTHVTTRRKSEEAGTRRRERRGEGTGNLQKGKRRPAQADLNAYARKYLA